MKKTMCIALSLILLVGLLLTGCGGDTDTDEPVATDSSANTEPDTSAPVDAEAGMDTIIQVGLGVEPSEASVSAADWDTEWSQKFGITLMEVFDSSGDDAWDPSEHPLVYVSSEGPGYSGLLSPNVTLPGLMIIDAYTHETVAAPHYDLGQEEYFEPHGSGVSPGGEWIYIPTGTASSWGSALGGGRLLIINARTLKIDRILATRGNPHHIKSFVDAQGRELTLIENFSDGTFYVLDPNDDNRVVGGINSEGLKGSGYLSFAHPSGKYIFISLRTPFRSEGGVAVVDTETWRVLTSIPTHDSSPIYVAFSGDGTSAYVSGGHESSVVKIDTSDENPRAWAVVGIVGAGTAGPYGVTLSWDETQLFTIGKGEGIHNRGNTIGLVDPTIMTTRGNRWGPGSRGSFYTECMRGDHGILHPDPEMNEMWISCNANFRTVIWDITTMTIKAILDTPNLGSTHNGAFVQYDADFNGVVLADQNGLQGPALQLKLEMLEAAASSN